MINTAIVDEMFDVGRATGELIGFHIFDRRVLFPLEQLPAAVKAETGIDLALEELRARSAAGWFPIMPREGSNELGAPLYTPSRVAVLSELAAKGLDGSELRLCAEFEEAQSNPC